MTRTLCVYPRPLINNCRGSARLMGTTVLAMFAAIAIAAAKIPVQHRWYLGLLALYVVLNAVATVRMLAALEKLELRSPEPDETMTALFDHTLQLSIMAMMAVMAALSLATAP